MTNTSMLKALAVLLLAAARAAEFPAFQDDLTRCTTTLNEIDRIETVINNFTNPRFYTLCPNTTWEIGLELPTGGFDLSEGRQLPLQLRHNAHVRCYEPGTCTFRGGSFHVIVWRDDRVNAMDVSLRGIVLDNATVATVLSNAPGSASFTDCTIENSANMGPVISIWKPRRNAGARRLGDKTTTFTQAVEEYLSSDPLPDDQDHDDRDLQGIVLGRLAFYRCLFQLNSAIPRGPNIRRGIITVFEPYTTLEIANSVFINNDYSDLESVDVAQNEPDLQIPAMESDELSQSSWAVVSASQTVIRDSCFVDNEFERDAPVILLGRANLATSNVIGHGNHDGAGNKLNCDFVIRFEKIEQRNVFSCVPYDNTQKHCSLVEDVVGFTRVPTPVPTPAPTNRPTPRPTPPPARAPTIPPAAIPNSVVPIDGCVDNLNLIESAETSVQDTNFPRYYTLCPNSVFNIAYDNGKGAFVDGMIPIFGASQLHIRCGVDGKVSNNCRFRGGSFHVLALYGPHTTVHGMTLSGITFENAATAAVVVDSPGSIHFIDCVFENMVNVGPVISLFDPNASSPSSRNSYNNGQRRRLQHANATARVMEAISQGDHRSLQQQDPILITNRMQLRFAGCVFQNNLGVIARANIRRGIITIVHAYTPVTIEGTVFRNNDYSSARTNSDLGWAISTASDIAIVDSCFLDNDFESDAPVIVNGNVNLATVNVFGHGDDPKSLLCEFVVRFPSRQSALTRTGFVCTPYDRLDSCAVTGPDEERSGGFRIPLVANLLWVAVASLWALS